MFFLKMQFLFDINLVPRILVIRRALLEETNYRQAGFHSP